MNTVVRNFRLVACLLSLCLCVFALAGTDESYKLQPEDVLRIQVYQEQQVNADIPVGKDGYISAPFVGRIKAEGKTTDELEAELQVLYKKRLYIRSPRVSITIVRFRALRASVNGFINRPGVYEFRPGDTVLSLLSLGGGQVPDRSDLKRVTLRRKNSSELIPIDLNAMLIKGDTSQNYDLQDGDELSVPEDSVNRIVVQGYLQRPGTYPYKEPMYLSDAVALAGGEIPYKSFMSRTIIVRPVPGMTGQYLRISANYVRFVKDGDNAQNVQLMPGDMVYVPSTKTPDYNQIGTIVNALFIFNRLFNVPILRQ